MFSFPSLSLCLQFRRGLVGVICMGQDGFVYVIYATLGFYKFKGRHLDIDLFWFISMAQRLKELPSSASTLSTNRSLQGFVKHDLEVIFN